ncbi:Scr1 family TA system antitoxin-like transcriptional regulator [Streptomyces sp. I05A-00742]|uniref:Scr1 family TA system antitoxin-like transcriptional regulator n=1 Tax=Streptomyces sp. I05A-00742 TaxID=2732853 RepID=UPI001487A6C4|nr:Scr1 family TA system antitoxin-like transcriptional regulator [Streptomyces sp. I05A-00742]
MPPRSAPTGRQRRLGTELRKMREHCGITVADAGAQFGADRTRISNIEAGRIGISAERLRALARIYACPDSAYIEALVRMTEERGKRWWEEYRESISPTALDLAELEHHAIALTAFQVVYIPGLLQTEEYARAVFGQTVPELSAIDVQRRVTYRMQRKRVIEQSPAKQCTFVVHEAALRMTFPGRDGQRRQLERLIEMAGHDGVTLRVIPFAAGAFPSANSSLTYASGPVPRLDTISLDTAHGSVLLDTEAHLEKYRSILRRALDISLPPPESLRFVRDTLEQL